MKKLFPVVSFHLDIVTYLLLWNKLANENINLQY